jgi:hypothetical protein
MLYPLAANVGLHAMLSETAQPLAMPPTLLRERRYRNCKIENGIES